MKIKTINGNIIIASESDTEAAFINSITQANEHFIFQLQQAPGQIAFVNLGPKAQVFNEAINILYSSTSDAVSLISNLGHTPFLLDGFQFESVEAFWQGLKFAEEERAEIAKLHGKKAKKIGKRIEYEEYIQYQGEAIRVGSPDHWELMRMACVHKFTQNEVAQNALLETGIRPLFHKPRQDSKTIPGPIMAGIWMDIRSHLRKENNLSSLHLNLVK